MPRTVNASPPIVAMLRPTRGITLNPLSYGIFWSGGQGTSFHPRSFLLSSIWESVHSDWRRGLKDGSESQVGDDGWGSGVGMGTCPESESRWRVDMRLEVRLAKEGEELRSCVFKRLLYWCEAMMRGA